MKKLLFILVATLFLSNIVTYAQKENNHFVGITLTQSKRKGPINKENSPATRNIIQPVNAYLCNNVICINFNKEFSTVTISIINELTGETVYTETCNALASININLDEEDYGIF